MAFYKDIRIAVSGVYDYAASEVGPMLHLPLPGAGAPAWVEKKNVYRVYRPATVLEAAKDKFKMLPLTHYHPSRIVCGDNFRELATGYTGENPFIDYLPEKNEVGIRSTVMLYDDEAVRAYENGEVQLSPGYVASFRWEDGTSPGGEKYDILMTEITDVNHLALLPAGRGGDAAVVLDGRSTIFDVIKETLAKDGEWDESKHKRDEKGQFSAMAKLADHIDTILNGTTEEKEKLKQSFFEIAKTPDEFKKVGVAGEKFTIKYGAITRHINKDSAHNITSEEWKKLGENLSDPGKCVITEFQDENAKIKKFSIYTKLKENTRVGVDLESIGKNLQINKVKTVFRRDDIKPDAVIIYPPQGQKITPEQQSLLIGRNSRSYTADGCIMGNPHDYIIATDEEIVKSVFDLVKETKTGSIFDLVRNPMVHDSLTWSGHKLQGRRKWNGLDISIENRKGSVRKGTDPDGHEWAIKMKYPYGYIRGTEGTDGDHLDCYLGEHEDAPQVFVIHQNDPETGRYDEDKVMLGFMDENEAKRAYMEQYDRPGFFGGMDTMALGEFLATVKNKRYKGKRIAI